MKLRQIRRPTLYREPNPPNRAGIFTMGPLRFATGKNKGRIVPTRPNRVKQILCSRCNLPFVRGLRPAALVLGFDPKTGQPRDEYVHRGCPEKVAVIKAMLAKFNKASKDAENRRRAASYTRHGPQGFIR